MSKTTTRTEEVKLSRIELSTFRPRSGVDPGKARQLAQSIKTLGLIHAPILRPKGDGFEVIVGGRRSQAARKLGMEKIPVVIREISDREALEMILTENVQREEMSAVDKGRICQLLRERFPDVYPSWESVGEKLGVDVSTIREWVRTTELPQEIKERIAPADPQTTRLPPGKIDYRTALQVASRIKDKPKQIEVVRKLVEKRIPQRLARQIIKEVSRKPDRPVETIVGKILDASPQLPFLPEHADLIRKGVKVQTSRKGIDPKIRPGTKVEAYSRFADLVIKDVHRKKLKDFTEEDARREGGYSLDEFKKVWRKLHGEWDPEDTVHVVQFKLEKDVVG